MDTTTITHVKKKTKTVYKQLGITAVYNASNNSVTLDFVGKQTFKTGGQITVNYSPPSGVSSEAGGFLNANDAQFTILPKAKGITPG